MSVLSSKTVLIVGQANPQVNKIEEALTAHGVKIDHLSCKEVTVEAVTEKKVDLVLLDHLHDGDSCLEVFGLLQTAEIKNTLPVFALIQDVDSEIQKVLTLGAADYLTADESTASVIFKMKSIFGQGLDYSGDSVIDITPTKATVNKSGARIYVVEDDSLLRNLLSIRFEKAEFLYKVNGNGENAVSEVIEFKPAVIILDLMLPGKDGFEVLTELKDDENTKHIPVIVFSNRDGINDRKRAQELGAAGFYVKAMTDLSELVSKIEALID